MAVESRTEGVALLSRRKKQRGCSVRLCRSNGLTMLGKYSRTSTLSTQTLSIGHFLLYLDQMHSGIYEVFATSRRPAEFEYEVFDTAPAHHPPKPTHPANSPNPLRHPWRALGIVVSFLMAPCSGNWLWQIRASKWGGMRDFVTQPTIYPEDRPPGRS